MNFDHWGNPDSWMDVFDHLLLVVGVWGGLAITVGLPVVLGTTLSARRQLKAANEKLDAVHESTVNDHDKALRIDLDERFDRLDENLDRVHTDIREERDERRERMRELRGDVDARLSAIWRRLGEK
ncbi:hypothetical protein B1R94_25870 [Mycolicibacterium litorale]|nr:hypothetical protein B1R94_25870 [Mycolicibacterium litorale]